MPDAAVAYIALGSNLGDRACLITAALTRLGNSPQIEVLKTSTLIETEPVGPGDQPGYLNAAASLRTTLPPRTLLDEMLSVERDLGRDRTNEPRWGPRLIDLDLLMYADSIINEPGLTVPHPRLHERLFVLVPLAEIAPEVMHPTLGVTVERLWSGCKGNRSSSS